MKVSSLAGAKPTGNIVLSSPSQFYPSYDLCINGISFDVGVDERGTVVYVATQDSSFATPEGAKVGITLAEVLALTSGTVVTEQGWGHYVVLPSGWNVGFAEGSGLTDGALLPGSRARWLFAKHH
jgi:hypothetical protein